MYACVILLSNGPQLISTSPEQWRSTSTGTMYTEQCRILFYKQTIIILLKESWPQKRPCRYYRSTRWPNLVLNWRQREKTIVQSWELYSQVKDRLYIKATCVFWALISQYHVPSQTDINDWDWTILTVTLHIHLKCMHTSLIPRLLPVFQCCTLKTWGAWYLILHMIYMHVGV